MKIGDLVHKIDIHAIENHLKSAPPGELDRIVAQTKATAFIVDMIMEVIECPWIDKKVLKMEDMTKFTINVLAASFSIATFRFAKRTNNFDFYCETLKKHFDSILDNMKGLSE